MKQYEAMTTTYAVPKASIKNVSSLKGKTVFYIPLIQQIPTFVVAADAMKTALAKVGMNLQVCNGKADPTAIASCVQQAINTKAAGIVTDAIPYGMAQNAFDSAKGKVPLIIADQLPPTGAKNTNDVSYISGPTDMPTQLAWWMIADSKGKAVGIFSREKDSPSSTAYTNNALPIFTKNCSGCKIQAKDITGGTPQLLASQVSANINSNPAATYYYAGFEDSLQPTMQGIQQSGKSSTMKLTEASGTVYGLGLLKGGQTVKAVVVVDEAYEGYALVDEILRMATKSGPVDITVPTRLFTSDNISSIKVTAAAQASGEWFGNNSFQSSFAKLWGVS